MLQIWRAIVKVPKTAQQQWVDCHPEVLGFVILAFLLLLEDFAKFQPELTFSGFENLFQEDIVSENFMKENKTNRGAGRELGVCVCVGGGGGHCFCRCDFFVIVWEY